MTLVKFGLLYNNIWNNLNVHKKWSMKIDIPLNKETKPNQTKRKPDLAAPS